jgi:hypothetical protein
MLAAPREGSLLALACFHASQLVNYEAREDALLRFAEMLHFHAGDEVAGDRRRALNEAAGMLELPHPVLELFAVVVHKVGDDPRLLALAAREPVMRVLRKEAQPLVEPALVDQACFSVEEVFGISASQGAQSSTPNRPL